MSHVEIKHKKEARDPIFAGAEKLALSVIPTLGSGGRNAVIRRHPVSLRDGTGALIHRPPMLTKDGVSVADKITSLPDPFEDMGCQLVKEAAKNAARWAGDGTSSATLLAYEMMKSTQEVVDAGANSIHVRRGMEKAEDAVVKYLEANKKDVKDIEEVKAIATISSQDEEIGSLVAMCVDEVGKDGAITLKSGMKSGVTYKVTDGLQLPVGYLTEHFKHLAYIEDAYILVATEKITSIRQLAPIMEQLDQHIGEHGAMKLVIFAEMVGGDALQTIVKNITEQKEDFQILVISPPYHGYKQEEIFRDIAIATGATLIEKTSGKKVENMNVTDLGVCDSVMCSATNTTIVGAKGLKDSIESRIAEAKAKLETEEDPQEQDYLKSRIAGLTGKIASIEVGGASAVAVKEKMHRVEDAIAASRGAHDSGILPGGGVAFLRAMTEAFKGITYESADEERGAKIVQDALEKQLYWVVTNAGEDHEEVKKKILENDLWSYGYNADKRVYGDMYEMKVIDPTRVPVTAIQQAVSVAKNFATIEVAIVEHLQ